jgi:hypothetical protein
MSSEDIDDNNSNNKNNSSSNINANNTKVATLKVAEVAEQHDVGRKIARVDPDVAERMGISITWKEKHCSKLASKGER